jgi:hypothetical protein
MAGTQMTGCLGYSAGLYSPQSQDRMVVNIIAEESGQRHLKSQPSWM